MPISMVQHLPGMTAEVYDEISNHMKEPLSATDGFISHAAEVTANGTTVTEVWRTREQWEQFFDAAVKPNLPPDLPAAIVTEIHTAFGR